MGWIVGLTVIFIMCLVTRNAFAKDGTSLYTPEQIANARENVTRYDWAKQELERTLKACEPWMQRSDEELWDLVTGQEIPRGIHVNPDLGCPSCGREVYRFGNYPWKVSLERPWKLECPSCNEIWPKNDFGAFHNSGLGDGGVFRRDLADESLLFNADHLDLNDPKRTYAVDDGHGWVDAEGNRWWFIAYYSHYCTWQELTNGVTALGRAYLLTGNPAYAHKGALLLDRIADVYPEMDLTPYSKMNLYNSHGSSGKGRIVGCIWETGKAKSLAQAYDMVYEGIKNDDELVRFLSEKATRWKIWNEKSSIARIRENIETNLLREFIASCKDGRISGNEGMTQSAMAMAAVILDDPQDSPPALDWCFEPGRRGGSGGGHIPAVLINEVDRDGVGNEASPSYSFLWMNNFRQCAEILEAGKKHRDYDLYRDYPRFKKMHATPYLLTARHWHTPRIGDTGKTGDPGMVSVDLEVAVDAFHRFGDPYFAQLAYKLNGNKSDELHTSVFDKDPEAIQEQVRNIIAQNGELELGNLNLNGYGLTVFRTGKGGNRRAAWLYYGRNSGHGHFDRLNYGMYYRGMDILPDLGYPEYADGKWPKRAGWTKNTISHNTVQVNRRAQETNWIGHCRFYETSGDIGIVEIASPEIYPETKDYRRTFITVNLSDTESYLVDIFRVAGGEDHLLSFHAAEGEATPNGLDLTVQSEGTYAGTDIPFGKHFDGPPDGRYRASGF
ncbi:MAG: heparinase II/III family protein, partial [bacterium]|nr:heparinase II/III family protein [bacterium]